MKITHHAVILSILFSLFVVSGFGFSADSSLFSDEERQWLSAHPVISVVVNWHPQPIAIWGDPSLRGARPRAPLPPKIAGNQPPEPGGEEGLPPHPPRGSNEPLQPVTQDEQHYFQGLAADYLKEVAKTTGISFSIDYLSKDNFRAIHDALQSGKSDLAPTFIVGQPGPGAVPPPLHLSAPYIRIPVVVVMRQEADYLDDINQLGAMKVAGVFSIQTKIRRLGKTIDIQPARPEEGLLGVASGKYDAFIGELSLISHLLSETPINGIKIVGELPIPSEFGIAVSPQIQEFIPIFDKAIAAIPQNTKDLLWKKWFNISYEKRRMPQGWVWTLVIAAALLILFTGSSLIYYRKRLHAIKSGMAELEPHLLCVRIDRHLDIVNVTEALCEVTGYSEDELIGRQLKILGEAAKNARGKMRRLLFTVNRKGSWRGELKLRKKNGSAIWTDVVITPSRRKDDTAGYTLIYQDASERKHYENLAIRDELTGLYNRRHFNAAAPVLLNKAAREKKYFSLLLLDIDNFKKYNDTYGHPEGDKVLAAIGKCLKRTLQRRNDLIFRLGGEEFGILALLTSKNEAATIAEKILEGVRNLNIKHKHNSPGILTVSIGAHIFDARENLSIEDIYKLADKRLYLAKEQGKNRSITAGQAGTPEQNSV